MSRTQRFLWIGIYLAIAAVGVRKFGKPESALPLTNYGRSSSTDTVLEQTLNVPQASQKIAEWLDTLPREKTILVIAPRDNMPAAITADLISYLAWPRPVIVNSDPAKTRGLLADGRDKYGAIGWCYLQPPPLKISKTFGPALIFTTMEAP
jgi:hypothetical protein